MTHFTAHVPGHGLVEWTPEKVDAHADALLATHQATSRWLPLRAATCRRCGQEWPCGAADWARRWNDKAERAIAPRIQRTPR